MLRRVWKPVAATVVIGTPGYFYYTKYKQTTFEFDVKVKGTDGNIQMSTRILPLLSMKALDTRIREHATFQSTLRPSGLIWNHTTATLASNDPIEDANSHQIIQRDDSDPSAPGDILFFTVMDGHGGHHTSQLLSRILINAVALELSSLVTNPDLASKRNLLRDIKTVLWSPPQATQTGLDADPQRVSFAIQTAFTKLDSELVNAPLRVLANSLDEESRKNKVIPDLSQHPLALATMLPAISGNFPLLLPFFRILIIILGSCAIMAVLDTVHRDLYIACTGDSRAVAGVWEQTEDGKGVWRAEVLSEDQTGRNPDELKRFAYLYIIFSGSELTNDHKTTVRTS